MTDFFGSLLDNTTRPLAGVFDHFVNSYIGVEVLEIPGTQTNRQGVYQRAFDLNGTNGYVYWSSTTPLQSPVTTTPPFTGTLIDYEIVFRGA